MVQPSTRRHQEEKQVTNWEEKILGTKEVGDSLSIDLNKMDIMLEEENYHW